MAQEILDFFKGEQISDEEFVTTASNEDSRDADLYSSESELEYLKQWEEVTNSSKEKLKQGNSTLQSIQFHHLK